MDVENNSSDLYDTLKCPITYEFFRDPVIGSDGHTYERENITMWIQKHATSPITREPMSLSSLRSNIIVKKMVEDFVTLSLQKQYQFRLDVDVCKSSQRPIFQSSGKTIYGAKWMLKHGPPIVLIQIDGAKAKCEASFYVKLSCHPHIVRTYGLVDSHSSKSIMILQEYAPEGDLSVLLREKNFRPTAEVLLEIFWQIVDAMICLADNLIIHGDLACRNVLAFRSSQNQPAEMLVKLTDFGLTRASPLFSVVDSPTSSTMKMIPIRYAAPEILLDTSPSSYSEKSDVYAFGVLMWEACSKGAIPYGGLKTIDEIYQERLRGKFLPRPIECTDEIWNIIVNCTQQEKHRRPSFKMIQDDLLGLRYQNKRQSAHGTSQVDFSYMNIADKTSSTNNVSDKNLQHSIYANSPIYRNLNNSLNEHRLNQSIYSKQSICEYYIPCEYCLQSINNDDFEAHQNVCSVRRIAKSFAKLVAQLPPLEITSCQFCDNLVPLNMIHIHQKTCTKTTPCLKNEFPTSSSQRRAEDSYVTFTYLKPVLPAKPSVAETDNDYAEFSDESAERIKSARSASAFAVPSETSSSSAPYRASVSDVSTKSSKSRLRKVFSKWKRKISS